MANLPDLMRSNRGLFTDFFRDLDDLFNVGSFGNGSRALANAGGFDADMLQPTMDVQEREDSFLISFDVPGIKKEDLKIDVTDNMLTISGERRQEVNEGKMSRSRRFGRFQQSFSLPTGVKSEQVRAHYDAGVLEVVVPKGDGMQRRSIDIQAGRAPGAAKTIGAEGTQSAGAGSVNQQVKGPEFEKARANH